MANLRTWSTTASSNNQATPDGFPEGMSPSSLNDTCRELMAALRTWYQDAEWIDWGHTPTRVADTQFSVGTDQTTVYTVGRRVRVIGATTGYGYVTASSYGAPNTTVTVTWDSGTTPTSPTTVSVGLLTPSNVSYPSNLNASTLGGVAASGYRRALGGFKTADTTRNTQTLSDDAHIAGIAVEAGVTYEYKLALLCYEQVNGAGGIQFNLFNSGGLTRATARYVASINFASLSSSFPFDLTSQDLFFGSVGASSPASSYIEVTGLITPTAAGNLSLRWAQDGATPNSTTLSSGSFLSLSRIS